MPVLYLIRHAQASFGDAAYDVLSERGERQSAVLAAALQARGITADRVVSGTLRRQRDTAGVCFPSLDGRLEIDGRWDEYDAASVLAAHGTAAPGAGEITDLGVPAGVTTQEFQALLDPALEAWVNAGESSGAHESWPAFQGRALAALSDLGERLGSGESGLAFTSGGVIATICTALLGGSGETFVAFNRVAVNAAITKVIYGRGGRRLVTFNDHGHLEADRELMTFR